ncbi:efflux RND transporter periplasmic adaptor subunit [Sphingorhabdus soli]|uniref:Efflux RND transporter periplasmic adaptor subunit n=1 Tax=Flavisphingopyxis soli TaxID=2601267 RepID=A0A5C6URM3_9SPHN|nr:efflux RND transporter periplasmic adaptor subunit [Sphingorhabdus soli]TXC73625.1 efflux RND transporter periplasmic adaptor subunit [Sphingorhabdus soli]
MNLESPIAGDTEWHDVTSEAPSRRRRNIIIAVVIALIAIAGIAFAMTRGGDESAPAATAAAADGADGKGAAVVSIIVPGNQIVTREITATGSLAARREMPVGIPGEGGQVSRVLVEPGQWVGAGQTLATIDASVQTQNARALAAQVRVAQADANLAQAELDRARKLVERGFISQADIDRKTATRDAANARVSVAQAQLGQAQASNRRLAIRAPAAGLVLTRNVEPGQVVSAGSGALFTIAKGGEMELLAQLSEDDLAQVSVGVPATVVPVGSNREITGNVWQISPVIDAQNRQGTARISVPYDRGIRPGGFASATIKAGATSSPVLPESAVMNDTKGNYVYIVDKDNKVVRRAVTTGTVTPAGLTIASGLNGDERVVAFAGGFLNPGEIVKPKPMAQSAATSATPAR